MAIEWQTIRKKMLAAGLSVTTPPDLMQPGKFPYLFNVRVRQAGIVQPREGITAILGGFAGSPVHSIKRFTDAVAGLDGLFFGTAGSLFFEAIGMDVGFSGQPLTFAIEHPSDAARAWMYVADDAQMRKYGNGDAGFTQQNWGVKGPGELEIPPTESNPAAVAAKPVVAVAAGEAGDLTPGAEYRYRYLYRTDAGSLSAPSLQSDKVTIPDDGGAVSITFTVSPDTAVSFVDIYRFGGAFSVWHRLPFDPEVLNLSGAGGSPVIDRFGDVDIASTDLMPEDNFMPFQSNDVDGNPIRINLSRVWGPFQGVIFAVGDPGRRGDLYWTNPGRPDGASTVNRLEVTDPTEPLMAGFLWDSRSWVFTSERLFAIYPNFAFPTVPDQFDANETPCGHGVIAPWAVCTGDHIYFVSKDGIYATDGGAATCLTDTDLYPLFPHESIDDQRQVIVAGDAIEPPNMTDPTRLRLEYHNGYVYFDYKGRFDGKAHTLIWDSRVGGWLYDKYARDVIMHHSEGGATGNITSERLLAGTADAGTVELCFGTSDDGTPIPGIVTTPAEDGGDPRSEKLWGDVFIEADTGGVDLSVIPYVQNGEVQFAATTVNTVGRVNKIIDMPDRVEARNLLVKFTWTGAPAISPMKLYSYMPAWYLKPEDTQKRVTEWHEFLPGGEDAYVHGIELWCNTFGEDKTIEIHADGAATGNTITVNSTAPVGLEQKIVFSWPSFKGRLGKLFHTNDKRWRLTKWNWIAVPEPLLEPDWDTNWRKCPDARVCYITGIKITADTLNKAKTVKLQSELEGVVTNLVPTGFGGDPVIQHNGRLTVSLSFTPFRAEQYRLYTLDQVPGRLYEADWITHPEPPILANWDSTYEDFGTIRIVKGFQIYCDTLGKPKLVNIEADGVVKFANFAIQQNREAHDYDLPLDPATGEYLKARVVRVLPIDTNKAFLYRFKWWAEDEPAPLANWNASYQDFGKDRLVKGVRIQADTLGAAKVVRVELDQGLYTTLNVTHAGRVAKNYDLPVGGNPPEFPRSRTARLRPTDLNPGQLYGVEWIADDEPFLLANWNPKWEDGGNQRAKFCQGCIIVADTQGAQKQVLIEFDGGQVGATLNVNQSGRRGVAYSFNQPFIANQVRARPTDANAAWLYSVWWIWEPAPELGTVWETEGSSLGMPGWHHEKEAWLALISTDAVNLEVRHEGVVKFNYLVAPTGGLYTKTRVPFHPAKDKIVKWRLTSPTAFRLFKKDCQVKTKAWGSDGPYIDTNPFGGPHDASGAEI